MSCYLHHVPGRIRIKSLAVKGKPGFATGLENTIRVFPGIKAVSANPLTGSVLIHYDESMTNAGAITEAISRQTGINLSSAVHADRYIDEALIKTGQAVGKRVGKAVLGIMIGQLLEGSPLALLAAAI